MSSLSMVTYIIDRLVDFIVGLENIVADIRIL